MRVWITVFAVIFGSHAWAKPTPESCKHFFEQRDRTDDLQAYLSSLFDHGDLRPDSLQSFSQQLQSGVVSNPISQRNARVNPILQVHYSGLQKILEQGSVDPQRLLQWANHNLQQAGLQNQERAAIEKLTQFEPGINWIKIHKGPHGPFAVMDSVVTQELWVNNMHFNCSKNNRGADAIEIDFGGEHKVSLKPDYPAENMSIWSAMVFANVLSEKYGLEPAYDLSNIKFKLIDKPVDIIKLASWGTLEPEHEVFAFQEYNKNNPQEEIVKKSGFRLITLEEIQFIGFGLRPRQDADRFPMGLTREQLREFAWLPSSVPSYLGGTRPVGTTPKHIIINGQPIFDFVGNVSVWLPTLTDDYYSEHQNKILYQGQVIGASYKDGEWEADISKPRDYGMRGTEYNGIRFVRSLKP